MKDISEMYAAYCKTVYGYLVRLCGNPELAEELTQETFYIATNRISSFREESSPSTWLCGIAKNVFYTHIKSQKRKTDFEILETQTPDPLEILIRSDRMMEGQQALHQLPEPYREVFTLRTFCDLDHRQIGRLFGKSEAWARVTYYRARQQLADLLKEDQYEL